MKLTFDVPEPPPLSVLVDDGELLVVVDEVVVVVDMVAGDQTVDRPTLKARAPNKTRTDHVSRRPGTESELRYRFQQNIRSMYFVLYPMRCSRAGRADSRFVSKRSSRDGSCQWLLVPLVNGCHQSSSGPQPSRFATDEPVKLAVKPIRLGSNMDLSFHGCLHQPAKTEDYLYIFFAQLGLPAPNPLLIC